MVEMGTITRCIRDLEVGETSRRDDAARELWEYFFADLMCCARRRLQAANASRGLADEEDAAERAFTKVCRGIERGQLRLGNRIDLFKVLRSAATREAIRLIHHDKRARYCGRHEAVLEHIPAAAPSAELLVLAFDACQRLLYLLDNDDLRQVAIWKLAGYSNEAIRFQLGCSIATVERVLAHIRETWRRKWDTAVPSGPAKSGPRLNSRAGDDGPAADTVMFTSPSQADQVLRSLSGLG